jgi:hypothetical protein
MGDGETGGDEMGGGETGGVEMGGGETGGVEMGDGETGGGEMGDGEKGDVETGGGETGGGLEGDGAQGRGDGHIDCSGDLGGDARRWPKTAWASSRASKAYSFSRMSIRFFHPFGDRWVSSFAG